MQGRACDIGSPGFDKLNQRMGRAHSSVEPVETNRQVQDRARDIGSPGFDKLNQRMGRAHSSVEPVETP